MITNTKVTVYNRYQEGKALPAYVRSVIPRAWFHRNEVVSFSEKMLISADIYRVRIPKTPDNTEQYVPYTEWTGTGWTLKPGDWVYIGEGPEIETPADLQKFKNPSFKITSWSDNDTGTSPHFRIQGT